MTENPLDSPRNQLRRLLPSGHQMKRTQRLTVLPALAVIHFAFITQDDEAKSLAEDGDQMVETNRSAVSRWIEGKWRNQYDQRFVVSCIKRLEIVFCPDMLQRHLIERAAMVLEPGLHNSYQNGGSSQLGEGAPFQHEQLRNKCLSRPRRAGDIVSQLKPVPIPVENALNLSFREKLIVRGAMVVPDLRSWAEQHLEPLFPGAGAPLHILPVKRMEGIPAAHEPLQEVTTKQ